MVQSGSGPWLSSLRDAHTLLLLASLQAAPDIWGAGCACWAAGSGEGLSEANFWSNASIVQRPSALPLPVPVGVPAGTHSALFEPNFGSVGTLHSVAPGVCHDARRPNRLPGSGCCAAALQNAMLLDWASSVPCSLDIPAGARECLRLGLRTMKIDAHLAWQGGKHSSLWCGTADAAAAAAAATQQLPVAGNAQRLPVTLRVTCGDPPASTCVNKGAPHVQAGRVWGRHWAVAGRRTD